MLNEKLELTSELKKFIRNTRESHGHKLKDIEENSNKKYKVSWLSQVEGKRTKTIKREDLIELFKIILSNENKQTTESEAEKYIENFLNNLANTTNSKTIINKYMNDDDIYIAVKNNLNNCIDTIYSIANQEDKELIIKALNTLIENFYANSKVTSTFIAFPFHIMLSMSDDKTNVKFFDDMSKLLKDYISVIIDKQTSLNIE